MTLCQLICAPKTPLFDFPFDFSVERNARRFFGEGANGVLGKGREGKGLKKGTECKTEKKRIKYKGNTVPITPVWKLSYKNHIQGQEKQSIMLVLIAIYTKTQ